ncbi:hypothetical protein RJD24_13520 [Bacillaceae bacterium IKA-2]|nr:hypothetical protein RJD24_13520 [Bacillaceae bacterium IKA-2]
MEKKKLQNHNTREEISEEFGTHRPMVERDLNVSIGNKKKTEKGEKQDEKTKKLRTKSKNSS